MKVSIQEGKQKDIFDTAKDLFWKYGIKKVSIEEICSKANVSKMTFYKFFPNKIELAKTIWVILTDKWMQKYDEIVHGDELFQEKVIALFKLKSDASEDVSMEFLNDLMSIPELQETMVLYQKKSTEIFTDFFVNSQKKGLIRKDIKVEYILAQIGLMTTLLENKELLSLYESPQELALEGMNFLFYGLLP